MMSFFENIINKKVTGVIQNYSLNRLIVHFENGLAIEFDDCAIVFDLGIIGHKINYISNSGTLGLSLELKRNNLVPEDFETITLSRDIYDFDNKNELVVAYQKVKIVNIM